MFAMTWKIPIETLMEKNDQVVMEKLNKWKGSFFKTVANFVAIAIQTYFDTREATKNFSMERIESISILLVGEFPQTRLQ